MSKLHFSIKFFLKKFSLISCWQFANRGFILIVRSVWSRMVVYEKEKE